MTRHPVIDNLLVLSSENVFFRWISCFSVYKWHLTCWSCWYNPWQTILQGKVTQAGVTVKAFALYSTEGHSQQLRFENLVSQNVAAKPQTHLNKKDLESYFRLASTININLRLMTIYIQHLQTELFWFYKRDVQFLKKFLNMANKQFYHHLYICISLQLAWKSYYDAFYFQNKTVFLCFYTRCLVGERGDKNREIIITSQEMQMQHSVQLYGN